MYCVKKKARRKDFKYYLHKDMINVWEDKYVYSDRNIAQYIHAWKHHIYICYP
jgi:hypothetical protein